MSAVVSLQSQQEDLAASLLTLYVAPLSLAI